MTAITARALSPSKPGMYRALRSTGSGIHAPGLIVTKSGAQRPHAYVLAYARPVLSVGNSLQTAAAGPCRPLRGQIRADQRLIGGGKPIGGGLALVPIRIDERRAADGFQPGDLVGRERKVGGGQVVGQLLVGAGTDDHRRDRGTREEPGQRHPRRRGAASRRRG